MAKNNEKAAREALLRASDEPKGEAVKGYDFNQGVNFGKIVESFSTTGYQATGFGEALDITKKMISDKAFIYLGYTSNMVSSGLRDIFRFLVEHKKVKSGKSGDEVAIKVNKETHEHALVYKV